MNISEMHVWFRQYAQQMGMQNVRAILPEQIDLLINTSITDIINQIITQNVGATNDRIVTDNSKIGQINALKTLYKTKEVSFYNWDFGYTIPDGQQNTPTITKNSDGSYLFTMPGAVGNNQPIKLKIGDTTILNFTQTADNSADKTAINTTLNSSETKTLIESIIGSSSSLTINYEGASSQNHSFTVSTDCLVSLTFEYTSSVSYTFTHIKLTNITVNDINKGRLQLNNLVTNYLYLVDFSLDYIKGSLDVSTGVVTENYSYYSNYFPVRVIDDMFLADTLNDFILSPRLRTPIVTAVNNVFDFYFGDFVNVGTNTYSLKEGLIPNVVRVSYIAKPAIVAYKHDISGIDVDCDLPEYLHVDILKHAVDLYRSSVQGSLFAAQQNNQVQRQEAARNNVRPDNEGYQS